MADTFEYKCSQCGESLTLPTSLLGQHGECPSCHHVEILKDTKALPLPKPVAAPALNTPFGGGPVTADSVKSTTNPYAVPQQRAFEFGSVNPDHRGRLGKNLWGVIISFTIATIWVIYIIAVPFFTVLSNNPERFENLSEEEIELEMLFSLAEEVSDFDRSEVENLDLDVAQETAGIAFLQGMGVKAIPCLILWLIGTICYLGFFHTLWAQIQDDPSVKFSPGSIVGFHFIPVGIGLAGVMLTDVNPLFSGLISFIALIAWWIIMFITYWKLADHMSKYYQRQGISSPQPPVGLALAFCIMQTASIIPFIGGLLSLVGFVLWFIVFFHLKASAIGIINHKMQAEQVDQTSHNF